MRLRVMDIFRLSASFKSLRYRRQATTLQRIHLVGQFRAIIERERVRADRNGHQFSLVLFSTGNPQQESTQLKYIAQVLANRIRLTDEVGWFDDERICVVLPYTSAAGAHRFVDEIYQTISSKATFFRCEIYTYPSDWFSNGKNNSAQLHFADLFPGWSTTKRPPWFSSYARKDDGGNITLEAEESLYNITSNCQSSTKTPEPIFHRPLPTRKRSLDIVGALFGLVVLSPLMLLVALTIKIMSSGPVLFKQPRVGYMGRTFRMWKFRTMKVNADPLRHRQYVAKLINGAAQNDRSSEKPMTKLDHDPQIIPFGRMLRKTCIDELPQLVNVLRGEMSLVGPRPPIPYEAEVYLHWHNGRLHILPGMTGLWQVSGKNRLPFKEMVRLDIQYARQQSLWLDIKILLKTPFAIATQIWDSLLKHQPPNEEVAESA